jgi:cullin 1
VKIFVYTLSDVLTRFENVLATSFKGEAGFGLSLQRACRRFVNWSKWRTSRSCHSAEILARHTDALLLQSYSTTFDELDMERSLRQIVRYLLPPLSVLY